MILRLEKGQYNPSLEFPEEKRFISYVFSNANENQ